MDGTTGGTSYPGSTKSGTALETHGGEAVGQDSWAVLAARGSFAFLSPDSSF